MDTAMPLARQLREATRQRHDRLEALPFAQRLAAGDLPLTAYTGYLRAMATIHAVLEHQLSVSDEPRITGVWHPDMVKLDAVLADLAYFAADGLDEIPAAADAAQQLANRLLNRSVESPVSLLGYVYVFEGAMLGAQVLAPQVAAAFDLSGEAGLSHLTGYGADTRERWQRCVDDINRLALADDERSALLVAAGEAFDGVHAVLAALHPLLTSSAALPASALNPEAGTHPVAQDPREIVAAKAAGERCLRAYPYLVWRYAERGRRFTDSDGAWLVTLADGDQAEVDRQVDWLGRVLATRGIPRLLLERHLLLLHDELVERLPARADDYARLRVSAERLAAERRTRITDDEMVRIRVRFDAAVGADWRARLPNTGEVLVAAWLDTRAGIPGVLDNVRDWHSDPARFPPAWVDAVDDCLAATALR